LSHNEVLNILAQHQKKWEAMANKLLYQNTELNPIDIVQDMYVKVFDDLTNNELQIENLIVNNKPHFGIVKTILKRIIQVKSKNKNKKVRLTNTHKQIADSQEQQQDIEKKIDEVLNTMYWFDRKLFNLYRKEFHSIRKLSKATKISHATVHKTIAKCKQELKNKIKL
jgi:transcriptional regulator of aromatic amino acid metabolism